MGFFDKWRVLQPLPMSGSAGRQARSDCCGFSCAAQRQVKFSNFTCKSRYVRYNTVPLGKDVIIMRAKLREMAKDARFDVRVSESLKETVTYAAKLRGRNLSDFIIAAIANEAARVINENHVIQLTLQDQKVLLEALNAPVKEPTDIALRAAAKYKSDVKHGRVNIQH